jgi:hypothetical protein
MDITDVLQIEIRIRQLREQKRGSNYKLSPKRANNAQALALLQM